MDPKLRGIGLGYKIYKAFIKYQGYMISDEQKTDEVRHIYYNLLKDDDIISIMDVNDNKKKWSEDSNKIMLIWKHYKNIDKLLKIVKETEKRNNRTYVYDNRLNTSINESVLDELKGPTKDDILKNIISSDDPFNSLLIAISFDFK